MAGWRQVVGVGDDRGGSCEAGGGIAFAHGALRAGWSGRKCFSLTGRTHRFLRPHEGSEAITQTVQRYTSVERALAYGPPGGARRPTATLAKSQPGHRRRRPRLGWFPWRATRPRSTAIRTCCGPRACWHAMRASMGRRRDTGAWPGWFRAPSVRFSTGKKSNWRRTRCATTWSVGTPSLSRRWRRFLRCVYRKVEVSSSGRPPSRRKTGKPVRRSSLTTKSRESRPSPRRRRTFAAPCLARPPDLRA